MSAMNANDVIQKRDEQIKTLESGYEATMAELEQLKGLVFRACENAGKKQYFAPKHDYAEAKATMCEWESLLTIIDKAGYGDEYADYIKETEELNA